MQEEDEEDKIRAIYTLCRDIEAKVENVFDVMKGLETRVSVVESLILDVDNDVVSTPPVTAAGDTAHQAIALLRDEVSILRVHLNALSAHGRLGIEPFAPFSTAPTGTRNIETPDLWTRASLYDL
jgi:hypothetical protein